MARRFTLNPVLVIISLVFWFWMWGIPGAILSMPMLAITKMAAGCAWPLSRGVKPSRFRRYISEFILHQFLHSLVLISGLSCKTTFNGRKLGTPRLHLTNH
jgi:hypothetical protein